MSCENFLKKTTRLIFNFLWGKRERIIRNTLIGHVLDGGIGIVDTEIKLKSLKASWIPKILKNEGILHCFLNIICVEHNIDINYILKTNVRKQSDFNIVKTLPVFYKEVFCLFNEAKTVLPFNQLNDDLFLQQTIWNNLYFKVKGKPLLFRNWLKSGIKYVKDLYDDYGNFLDNAYFSNIIVNKSNWLFLRIYLVNCLLALIVLKENILILFTGTVSYLVISMKIYMIGRISFSMIFF